MAGVHNDIPFGMAPWYLQDLTEAHAQEKERKQQ